MYKNKLLSIKGNPYMHPIYGLELPAEFRKINILKEIAKILSKEQINKKDMIKRLTEDERHEWEFLLSIHKRNIVRLEIMASLLAA